MPQKDENEQPKSNGVNRRQFITRTAAGAAGAVALTSVLDACGGSSSSNQAPQALAENNVTSQAWRFGVMADTQWVEPDDGNNPDTSAVSIANQIQQQFINAGVKFVVHVGDLADNPTNIYGTSTPVLNKGEDARALYAQALYNAGIGFFPLRGNHDDNYAGLNAEFLRIYPQTQNGVHNNTPSDILGTFAANDTQVQADASNQAIPTNTKGSTFTVGSNFSSPTSSNSNIPAGWNLNGLSYSFDFNNARFILLDQFTPIGVTGTGNLGWDASGFGGGSPTTINLQQPWISSQLSGRPSGGHAFVFSHKGLLTLNHSDGLFSQSSGNSSINPTLQDAFISSLVSNGARYLFCGHDHMYDRSLVSTTTGTPAVTQIVTASDSGKFYIPIGNPSNAAYGAGVTNDQEFDVPAFAVAGGFNGYRQTPIQQELSTVGYYIVTVDGANASVDYYSAQVYPTLSGSSELLTALNFQMNFVKQETFGYGLNGQQFMIAQGAAYTSVQDASPWGTTAKILGGKNNSTLKDSTNLLGGTANGTPNGRPFTKAVTTGWDPSPAGTKSDVLVLQGMTTSLGNYQTDSFALSMGVNGLTLNSGFVIATINSSGAWTNAVNENFSSGAKNFVNGPWKASYGVGTYGIDPTTNTVWAVLNYNGPFAIAVGV
ncbi:MAG: metallophosphoesterase [Candidatus Korobacteraceae bacterium]|jgi:hypothetical protein